MLNEKDKAIVEKIKAGQVFDEDAVSQLLRIIDSLESQVTLLERLIRKGYTLNKIGNPATIYQIKANESIFEKWHPFLNADKNEYFDTYVELASFLESQLNQAEQ